MPEFRPGFRFSLLDAGILLAGIATVCCAPKEIALVTATAVGHFFLFCNVFRISRGPELTWAALFVMLSSSTMTTGRPPWGITISAACGLAAILICRELKLPSYHGVFWKKFNPSLADWWRENRERSL